MSGRTGRSRSRISRNGNARYKLGVFEIFDESTGNWILDQSRGFNKEIFADPYYNFDSWEWCLDESHGAPPYDVGGPFRKLRVSMSPGFGDSLGGQHTLTNRDGNRRYRGGFEATSMGTFYDPGSWLLPGANQGQKDAAFPDMSDAGTKAWNRAKPKIAKANMFQFLAEVHEVPEMLKLAAKDFSRIWDIASSGNNGARPIDGVNQAGRKLRRWMTPKKAADEFVNSQFGWAPFLGDMKKFHDTLVDSKNIIDKLSDENGKSLRKRVPVTTGTTVEQVASGTGQLFTPIWLPGDYFRSGSQPTWTVMETKTTTTWASGKFRYYRPEFDRSLPDYLSGWNEARRQMDLYGLRISPSNLYNIVPWSWAVDWVSNARDYLDRASDYLMDGITAEYFYVMQHVTVQRSYINILPLVSGDLILEARKTVEIKERREGSSPFGLTLSWDNLTPRQLGIAGALGLSRR
jgi:hypothetical protein